EAGHILKRRGSDVLVDACDIRSVDLLFRKKLELRKSEETDGSQTRVDDRGCETEAGEVFHLADVTVDAATFMLDVVAVQDRRPSGDRCFERRTAARADVADDSDHLTIFRPLTDHAREGRL